MNTQNLPIEDQKIFEELLESHLDIPKVEEEGSLEVSASTKKENAATTDECVMPEKLRSYMRHENNASYKQHVCGIAKKRQLLAKKEKSKAVTKKQTVFEKALYIANKEQLLDSAAGLLLITPPGVIFFLFLLTKLVYIIY